MTRVQRWRMYSKSQKSPIWAYHQSESYTQRSPSWRLNGREWGGSCCCWPNAAVHNTVSFVILAILEWLFILRTPAFATTPFLSVIIGACPWASRRSLGSPIVALSRNTILYILLVFYTLILWCQQIKPVSYYVILTVAVSIVSIWPWNFTKLIRSTLKVNEKMLLV